MLSIMLTCKLKVYNPRLYIIYSFVNPFFVRLVRQVFTVFYWSRLFLFIFEAFCLNFVFDPNNLWSIKTVTIFSVALLRYHYNYSYKVHGTCFQSKEDIKGFLFSLLSKYCTFRLSFSPIMCMVQLNLLLMESLRPKILLLAGG